MQTSTKQPPADAPPAYNNMVQSPNGGEAGQSKPSGATVDALQSNEDIQVDESTKKLILKMIVVLGFMFIAGIVSISVDQLTVVESGQTRYIFGDSTIEFGMLMLHVVTMQVYTV